MVGCAKKNTTVSANATGDSNKVQFNRFYDEVFGKHNLAAIDELVSPNIINHATPPGWPAGTAGVKKWFGMLFTAIPDYKETSDEMIADGDKVWTRWTATGTWKEDLMGMKATGKPFTATGVGIVRFENGKAVEHWGWDNLMQALMPPHEMAGGAPPPPPAKK